MALIRCDFFSDVLGRSTSMTVILPQHTQGQIGLVGGSGSGPAPVLYLLHGLSDDDTTWVRRTSIERYVSPLGLAVVMPQAQRSFYLDEAHGDHYWTFLSEELPEVAGTFFRLSQRREDTYVAGLSMGGYGALRWALRQPERFAAAASLSGAVDLAGRLPAGTGALDARLVDKLLGARAELDRTDDLMWLVAHATVDAVPPLYLCCGTEDVLYHENERFVAACWARGLAVTTDFGPGEHEWDYWDAMIQRVLAWLPLPDQHR